MIIIELPTGSESNERIDTNQFYYLFVYCDTFCKRETTCCRFVNKNGNHLKNEIRTQ